MTMLSRAWCVTTFDALAPADDVWVEKRNAPYAGCIKGGGPLVSAAGFAS